jgi:hypothetical protein
LSFTEEDSPAEISRPSVLASKDSAPILRANEFGDGYLDEDKARIADFTVDVRKDEEDECASLAGEAISLTRPGHDKRGETKERYQ